MTETPESAEPAEVEDETKRLFREALERKRGQSAAKAATGHGTESKAHGAHGPAAARRRFRRKSG